MRHSFMVFLLGLTSPFLCKAQSACTPDTLPQSAKAVAAIRHQLHEQAVAEDDPRIPEAVAVQLLVMKEALVKAAQAAFACASPAAEPQELEGTLAGALHANLSTAADTVIETRGDKDLGVYGSDLAVQVFPLYGSPKYYEVDFRYGIECGDDNLLLVFATGNADNTAGTSSWHEVLRWDAAAYQTASDAFGDFVLLTPLSGFPGQRNWRFVVAHGTPGCKAPGNLSRFDLDILEPRADPARPQVVWHLDRAYGRNQVPRLSTTEDTLTFELRSPDTETKASAASAPKDTYRYRIGRDNQVEPLTASDRPSPTPPRSSASTHSPE